MIPTHAPWANMPQPPKKKGTKLKTLAALFSGLGEAFAPDPQAEEDAMRSYYNDPTMENQDALLEVLGRAGAYRPPHSYFTPPGGQR